MRVVHIFFLTIIYGILELNFNFSNYYLANEMIGTSVVMGVYFLTKFKIFNQIDQSATIGLLALNLCNIMAITSVIKYEQYTLLYLFVTAIFLAIIIYFLANGRFSK